MGEPKRVGSIEIDQDLGHVRHLWVVQRVGWAAMALVVLGGLLGVFGHGPLSDRHAQTTGLKVDYERFARHGATSILAAEVEPAGRRDGRVTLWIAQDYLAAFALEGVVPEPESVESRGDVLLFTFAADPSRPARITLHMRPDKYWGHDFRGGVEGGESVSFRQFVYP